MAGVKNPTFVDEEGFVWHAKTDSVIMTFYDEEIEQLTDDDVAFLLHNEKQLWHVLVKNRGIQEVATQIEFAEVLRENDYFTHVYKS